MNTSTKRWMGWGIAAMLVTAAACSDGTVGPAGDVSASDLEFLADESDQVLDGILGAEMDAQDRASGTLIPAPGVMLSVTPVTRSFEFSRSRTCHNGGTVSVSGSGQIVVDRGARTVEMDVAGEKLIEDCARQRSGIVFTMSGRGSFTSHRKKVQGQLVEGNRHAEGSFRLTTNAGRTKECSFNLDAVFDPDTNSWHLTGEFCGRRIDRTRTRG
ncbi:MAG: hypothetical protein ACE5HQ_13230 [Gemmatimonadota bacterium]